MARASISDRIVSDVTRASTYAVRGLHRGSLAKRAAIAAAVIFIAILSLLQIHDTHGLPFPSHSPHAEIESTPSTCSEGVTTARELSPLWTAVAPVPDVPRHIGNAWLEENQRQLKALFKCIALDNCGPNQAKIVILHSHHFKAFYYNGEHDGWTGGENIWARSVMKSLRDLGYTYLYAEQNDRALQLYQLFPSFVKAVLMEDYNVDSCFRDRNGCIKSPIHPEGFPIWLLFSFYFWSNPNHPLGARWVLAPENYTAQGQGDNTFLGYSVEQGCMELPFVPHDERPMQGYAMAKRLSYFAEQRDRAWPLDFYDSAAKATEVKFIAGAFEDTEWAKENGLVLPELPGSITNRGLLNQSDFMREISLSRVLVGVGRPAISPTPYEALCLGVPFINPIIEWDRDDPHNRRKWQDQHGGLRYLDPPYVYNVFKNDREGFVDAVSKAIAAPIERFFHPDMTSKAVEERLRRILETDWKGEAEVILVERVRNRQGEMFDL